jgi:sugar phosphate isomerase/epimerase
MKIETHKLTETEAAAAVKEAGYIVCPIGPNDLKDMNQAVAAAVKAAETRGLRMGIFKLCAVVEPIKKPKTEAR